MVTNAGPLLLKSLINNSLTLNERQENNVVKGKLCCFNKFRWHNHLDPLVNKNVIS